MAAPHRIDVHCHFAPPEWLAAQGQNIIPAIKNWTVAWSIEDMDKAGVEKAMMSVTTPGLWFESNERARKIARHANDYAAKMRADHRTGEDGAQIEDAQIGKRSGACSHALVPSEMPCSLLH